MPVSFGTDGWRAVISETFTFHNLRMVTQAIADAVASEGWLNGLDIAPEPDPKKMVVGFDTRFLSDRYAKEAARVLAANGFSVFLCQADAPTPVISYAVKKMNAIGGIMITASHNAPRYNGVKLKAAYGGSALPELCRKVEVYLNDNESLGRGPNLIEFDIAREKGLITRFNPLPDYYEHLRTLINLDIIADNPQYIVVDSMYGAGRGVIRGLLDGTGCEVHEIRHELNPGFGGVHPEPIGKYLNALSGAICMGKGSIGLATDGDADRIGAMDERGVFVDPHKIMSLCLRYLTEKRKMTGAVVRTVSTTHMIDLIARKYNLEVHETPVGFNHIADYMLRDDILIGGEESGGISFKGNIPEGDGILLGLLMVEIIAEAKATLSELVANLLEEYGPAHYARRDQRLKRPIAKEKMVDILVNQAPKEIGGENVSEVSTRDGVKYILDDNSWLLIRPSGTEPVLRIYAEGRTEDMVNSLLAYGEAVASKTV